MRRKAKIILFPGSPPPPTDGASAEAGDERGLVAVHRCDQPEAMVVKSLLESEGIPTLLRSRIAHSVHPFTVGAQGEVRILVPAADAARSRRLLARHASARK